MKTIPMQQGVGARIRAEVGAWPGISQASHRLGGTEFRLGKREIGHLHGDVLADLPFPVKIWEQLVRGGFVLPVGMAYTYRLSPPNKVGAIMGLMGIPSLFARLSVRCLPAGWCST